MKNTLFKPFWRHFLKKNFGFLICNSSENLLLGVNKINLKFEKYWNLSWGAVRALKFYKNSLFKTFWKFFFVSRLWNKKFQIGVIIWVKKINDQSSKRKMAVSNIDIATTSTLKKK